MEKPNLKFSNHDHIKGSLDNMKTNIKFNLDKINEVISILKKAARGIVDPVEKLKDKFYKDISTHKKAYVDCAKKIDAKREKLEELKNSPNEGLGTNFILEEVKANATLTSNYLNLSETMDKIIQIVALFNELFDTNEYSNLTNRFNEEVDHAEEDKTKSDGLSYSDEVEENNNNKSKSGEKKKKNKLIGNKRQRNDSNDGSNKNNGKKREKSKKKKKSKKKSNNNLHNGNNNLSSSNNNKIKHKKLTDDECALQIKEKFPDCNFISKTFLARRVKRVTNYKCNYDYSLTAGDSYRINEDDTGKSISPLKHVKIIVKFEKQKYAKKDSKFVKMMEEKFKIFAAVIPNSGEGNNSEIVIYGEVKTNFEELNTDFNTNNDYKDKFNITYMSVFVFAFAEEMFSEINMEEDDIYLGNDLKEEDLMKYNKDYERLKEIREEFAKLKAINLGEPTESSGKKKKKKKKKAANINEILDNVELEKHESVASERSRKSSEENVKEEEEDDKILNEDEEEGEGEAEENEEEVGSHNDVIVEDSSESVAKSAG
jgi:hypothetical protein